MTKDYLPNSFLSETLTKNIESRLIDYLFPYKYKNGQKELIKGLINNPKVLVYAQTGYGESICSLIAVIMNLLNPATNIKKIIVLVRMKTQIFRILVECYKKVFHGKTVYCEGSSNENQIILDELRTKDHELIFATFGGSFSEGIEIKDKITNKSKISLIIFCGIPVPPPTIQQKILQTKYLQRYATKIAYLFLYWLPMYQTLLQAAGRGIRSPNDFTAIICLGDRLFNLCIFSDEYMIKNNNVNTIKEKFPAFYTLNNLNYNSSTKIERL